MIHCATTSVWVCILIPTHQVSYRGTPQTRHATAPVCAKTSRTRSSSVHASCRFQTWHAPSKARHATPWHATPRGKQDVLLSMAGWLICAHMRTPSVLRFCRCLSVFAAGPESTDSVLMTQGYSFVYVRSLSVSCYAYQWCFSVRCLLVVSC